MMDIILVKNKLKDKLIKEIESLSEEDLLKIDNGTHDIKIKIEKIRKREQSTVDLSKEIMKNYEQQLYGFSTREDGVALLSANLKDKASAECFAKYMSVSFLKQDKREYIITKIVEATIGARLRSLAIKGESL